MWQKTFSRILRQVHVLAPLRGSDLLARLTFTLSPVDRSNDGEIHHFTDLPLTYSYC
jgi:hypothetical protein